MFLAQNHPIPRAKQSPSRRPRGGGGGGGCAAAEVRGGSGRVVVPPRFVTVPCLCVALGGVACLGRRRLALLLAARRWSAVSDAGAGAASAHGKCPGLNV